MPGRPPIPITVISAALILAGAVGILYHAKDFWQTSNLWYVTAAIFLLRLLAAVAGVYLLRGLNWARWLAIAWIALHAVISIFHTLPELIMHLVLLAAFVFFLCLTPAAKRFYGNRISAAE